MNVICGRYNFETKKPVEAEEVDRMCHAFDCYGPGEQKLFCEKELGIGVKQLTTDKVEFPLCSENGLIRIAFEGKIYDSQNIRDYLLQKGHLLKGREDGELIIHLYEEMGQDCIKKINGVFIFALWDKKQQRLFLFRDRLGVKSVFYAISDGALIFGSEIKPILRNKGIKKEVDFKSLHCFLSYNYVPAPFTLFRNIKKLPPGHCLICEKAKITLKKYWDIQLEDEKSMSGELYKEKFSQLLETAVKRHLDGNEPTGLLLSGGIDSSSIGFFMSRLQDRPIKTFTLGFSERDYDEDRKIARYISRHLGAEHNEFFLGADKINIQALKEIIYLLDDPVADPAVFTSYYIGKFASKHVKIALTGEGADELLAGYESYIADKLNRYFIRLPFRYAFRSLFSSLADHLPVSNKPRSAEYKIKSFLRGAGDHFLKAHFSWRQFFSDQEKKKLLIGDFQCNASEEIDPFEIYEDDFNAAKTKDLINRLLYVDTKVLLPDFLRVFDVMGKRSQLEMGFPFLDYEVVEFLFKVPSDLKLKGFTSKYLLKKAMAKNFPDKIFDRAKKGFSAPVSTWIKGEWKNMVLDILSDKKSKSMGYFNQEYIQELLNGHFRNIKNNSWKILGLVNFCLWHDAYLES